MNDAIKKLDKDQLYTSTIVITSRGDSDHVTMSLEVSHVLDEDFDDQIPASYGVAREIMMGLRKQTTMYAPTEEDLTYLSDPTVSDEDKARYILEHTEAQDEAVNATLN